jgi:hypothetical protein
LSFTEIFIIISYVKYYLYEITGWDYNVVVTGRAATKEEHHGLKKK